MQCIFKSNSATNDLFSNDHDSIVLRLVSLYCVLRSYELSHLRVCNLTMENVKQTPQGNSIVITTTRTRRHLPQYRNAFFIIGTIHVLRVATCPIVTLCNVFCMYIVAIFLSGNSGMNFKHKKSTVSFL